MKSNITFSGGVHPDGSKNITKDLSVKNLEAGDVIVLPLSQHIGNPAKAIVKTGDSVQRGQLIAQQEGFISSNIHSSVSGKIVGVKKYEHPVLGKTNAIVIENDHKKDTVEPFQTKPLEKLSSEDIVEIIKKAGIVGLGGAAFPSYVKAGIKEGTTIDSLLINGVECEPFLTCDYRIMIENTKELVQGIQILNKAIKADKVYIAVEDNKPVAIQKLKGLLYDKGITNIEVKALQTKYPQGGEKQIIKAVLDREVPPVKLPLEVGCVVQNVGTCVAIYCCYKRVTFNRKNYHHYRKMCKKAW
jgi:electron transport complex protein RnfC